METKTKRKYVAPAVLETLWLEMDAQILYASSTEVEDADFEEVETMGQELGEDMTFEHKWE